MIAQSIVEYLTSQDIYLSANDDKLIIDAGKGKVTPELRKFLQEAKEDLIDALSCCDQKANINDEQKIAYCSLCGTVFQLNTENHFFNQDDFEHYEERAAIMEYDGGLFREEAEKLAFSCVSKFKH